MRISRYNPEELLFCKAGLSEAMRHYEEEVRKAAAGFSKAEFSKPIPELAAELASKYTLEVPSVDKKNIEVLATEVEVEVRSGYSRRDSWMSGGSGSYQKKAAIEVTVPIVGDTGMLALRPNSYDSNPPRGKVEQSAVMFTVIQGAEGEEKIKREIDERVASIEKYLDWQAGTIAGHAESMLVVATRALEARKQQLEASDDVVSKLGYKIKKSD